MNILYFLYFTTVREMSEMDDAKPTRTTPFLSADDAEAMVGLVSRSCDPAAQMTVAERRDWLVRGIVRLVDADTWIWAIGQSKPDRPSDAIPFAVFDGGWRSDQERMDVWGVCLNQDIAGEVNRVTAAAWDDMRTRTWMRSDAWDDDAWLAMEASKQWNAVGLEHFLISIFPMEEYFYSVLGVHRRLGRPAFSERDRTVLHIVWQQVDWLHRRGLDVPAGSQVVELSLRERQVLLLLLAGRSRKEAARSLALSEHTVSDYMKGIYRKLEVTTRGELMAKFIPQSA